LNLLSSSSDVLYVYISEGKIYIYKMVFYGLKGISGYSEKYIRTPFRRKVKASDPYYRPVDFRIIVSFVNHFQFPSDK